MIKHNKDYKWREGLRVNHVARNILSNKIPDREKVRHEKRAKANKHLVTKIDCYITASLLRDV